MHITYTGWFSKTVDPKWISINTIYRYSFNPLKRFREKWRADARNYSQSLISTDSFDFLVEATHHTNDGQEFILSSCMSTTNQATYNVFYSVKVPLIDDHIPGDATRLSDGLFVASLSPFDAAYRERVVFCVLNQQFRL